MRIAIIQDYLRMGGTERQSVLLANAYAAAGHATALVNFRPGGRLTVDVSPHVRHVVLQDRDRGIDWWAPRLARTMRELRPDIVQLMGRAAQIVCWRLPDQLPEARFVATFRTGKEIPWLHRQTLRAADAIVANSHEARERLATRYGLRGPHVQVIRNAVAAPVPAPAGARDDIRRELGTSRDTVVFLCTAMLRPEKGHRDLIEIVDGLELEVPWELWIAGDGPEMPVCRDMVTAFQLTERVKFLGLRHDVARLYAGADLAVLASQRESLPNFLVEAQWLGLPVVAMDVAGVGETFAPGTSGLLVPAGDIDAFAAALQELAVDIDRRTRMAAAARTFAAREFDPQRQNERYLELFNQLVGANA